MLENCGESSRAGSDPALEKSVENLPKASRDRKGVSKGCVAQSR